MSSIIITVTDENHTFSYDLDVPCDLIVEKLIQDIAETLNGLNPMLMMSSIGGNLICKRINRTLLTSETLNDAGIRNGDYVIFSRGGL